MTITGYALTAVYVLLLAVTPYIGAAGVAVAAVLIMPERTGTGSSPLRGGRPDSEIGECLDPDRG